VSVGEEVEEQGYWNEKGDTRIFKLSSRFPMTDRREPKQGSISETRMSCS
jgi:hypothetical protein